MCRTGLSARMMPGRALGARPRRARGAYRRALWFQFVGAPLGWACERGLDRRCFIFIQFLLYFTLFLFKPNPPAVTAAVRPCGAVTWPR